MYNWQPHCWASFNTHFLIGICGGLRLLSFLACLPLIEADLPAVLALDERCLGGLWTRSGYQREIESPLSDLRILASAPAAALIEKRRQLPPQTAESSLAAIDPNTVRNVTPAASDITLLGIGCLWAILEEAHITTLAIEPAYQKQKLGLLLLSDLLSCAQMRGLTRATLEVRASNIKALKLYQKFDFKEAGQRKRYYADGENARILWRNHLQRKDCYTQVTQHRESAIANIKACHQHTVLTLKKAAENALSPKEPSGNKSAQTT